MTPLGYHSLHCHHDDNHPNLLHHIHMSHGVNLPPAAADAGGHSGGGGGGSSRGRMPNFFFGPPDEQSKMAFEPAMLHHSASFSSSAAGGGATQTEEVQEARGAAQALYMQQQQAQDQEESAAALEEELMVQVEGYVDKKGRRLGFEQVKALEKAFEVENRLEPERKARLAGQLGLQPRQVAVWFQNRRARWKTKQMERDFGALRSKFEALKADRDKLLSEKEQLQAELNRLKDSEIKEGQHTMQSPLEGQALNSPVTLVASCSVNTDHETGAVVELQDEHGSNKTTIAPLSFQDDQVMAEEPTKTVTVSTITTNPHGVASQLFRVQHFHTLRMEHNESLSSTEEYNSDDGGAIVDSPTSNTRLIRMNEVDHNTSLSLISNDHQHTLFNNHLRITPNPCQQLAHVKPNIINIKNEASWEGDQLHHPDANNCVHLINLPSEWYNW